MPFITSRVMGCKHRDMCPLSHARQGKLLLWGHPKSMIDYPRVVGWEQTTQGRIRTNLCDYPLDKLNIALLY